LDLHVQDVGTSVCQMLGGAPRTQVPLYVNINRRTVQRTPEAFAQSAIDAMTAGFPCVQYRTL
jgi:galactonate dehydratase